MLKVKKVKTPQSRKCHVKQTLKFNKYTLKYLLIISGEGDGMENDYSWPRQEERSPKQELRLVPFDSFLCGKGTNLRGVLKHTFHACNYSQLCPELGLSMEFISVALIKVSVYLSFLYQEVVFVLCFHLVIWENSEIASKDTP